MSDKLSLQILNVILPSVVVAEPDDAAVAPTPTPHAHRPAVRKTPAPAESSSEPAGPGLPPAIKSLLLPGWGQISEGRSGAGVAFAALIAAAAATSIYEFGATNASFKNFEANNVEGDPNRQKYMDETSAHGRITNLAAGLALAGWAVAIADAHLHADSPRSAFRVLPAGAAIVVAASW